MCVTDLSPAACRADESMLARDNGTDISTTGHIKTLGVYEVVLSAKVGVCRRRGCTPGPQIQEPRDDRNTPPCPTVRTHGAVNFFKKLHFLQFGGLCRETGGHMDPSTIPRNVSWRARIISANTYDICCTQYEPPGRRTFEKRAYSMFGVP